MSKSKWTQTGPARISDKRSRRQVRFASGTGAIFGLPPIQGDGAFTKDAPDIMLTEIHRQAAESAIIRLATMAREGVAIGFGQYDTHVWKMRKYDVAPEQALRGGQVICGMNATRLQLNNAMRQAAGFGPGWSTRRGIALTSLCRIPSIR